MKYEGGLRTITWNSLHFDYSIRRFLVNSSLHFRYFIGILTALLLLSWGDWITICPLPARWPPRLDLVTHDQNPFQTTKSKKKEAKIKDENIVNLFLNTDAFEYTQSLKKLTNFFKHFYMLSPMSHRWHCSFKIFRLKLPHVGLLQQPPNNVMLKPSRI